MSNYRIASLAYPREYWAEHGDEIIATANELNNDSWSFRESRQLVSNGLRTRSFEATGGDLRQVWVQGLAIFLFISLLQGVSGWVGSLIGIKHVEVAGPVWVFVGFAVSLVALSISTRWPVMLLIAMTAIATAIGDSDTPLAMSIIIVAVISIPIAIYGNGRPVMSPRALAAAFVVVTASTSFWFFGPSFLTPVLLLVGLLVVRFDQRLLAAAATNAAFVVFVMVTAMMFSEPGMSFETVNGFPVELFVAAGAVCAAAVMAAIVTFSTRRSTRN